MNFEHRGVEPDRQYTPPAAVGRSQEKDEDSSFQFSIKTFILESRTTIISSSSCQEEEEEEGGGKGSW